jgi:hypothetical protein
MCCPIADANPILRYSSPFFRPHSSITGWSFRYLYLLRKRSNKHQHRAAETKQTDERAQLDGL